MWSPTVFVRTWIISILIVLAFNGCATAQVSTSCGVRQLAATLSRKILPGCVQGDVLSCEDQVNQVSNSLNLANLCKVSRSAKSKKKARGRRLDDNVASTLEKALTSSDPIVTNRPSSTSAQASSTFRPSEAPASSHPLKNIPIQASKAPSAKPTESLTESTNNLRSSPFEQSVTFYVDPNYGNDLNPGMDRDSPFATIRHALEIARIFPQAASREIILLAGKHRLTEQLNFGPADSRIAIIGEAGTYVTGAISLAGLVWTQESSDVYSTIVPRDILEQVEDLSVLSYNGEPMIRARFPNKNKYTDFVWAASTGISKWSSMIPQGPVTRSIKEIILANATRYGQYVSGEGGSCTGVFEPPVGYFCVDVGDADGACAFSRISQATLTSSVTSKLQPTSWSRVENSYFHVVHYLRWGGWAFRVRNVSSSIIDFAEGGFQEARGDCGQGGAEWLVDNIPELLDAPNEFYLNRETGLLRMKLPSGSTQSPNEAEMELGSNTTTLFRFSGTNSSNPITKISIHNIKFERTSPAFMKPHEMPSGGDWSITRSGAVFFENARDISVLDCSFTKLGSHGVFLSNHIRTATIARNVFYGIDGTCIAMVGDPKYNSPQPWNRTADQDYVSGVVILNNMMSKMGLTMIQSAGIFGCIATDVLSYRNVIFDGPRAGIIFNDLYGNNMVTRENILFNMVTITQDHGPYNVWDRQQWLLPDNFKSNPNIVDRNLLFATAWGDKVVDLDDGARDHQITNNVVMDGFVKFKGGLSNGTNNIIALTKLPSSGRTCVNVNNAVYKDPQFVWRGNTCYGLGKNLISPYIWSKDAKSRACDRNYLVASGNRFLGVAVKFSKCALKMSAWKKLGQDIGSKFTTTARPAKEIVQACATLLQAFGA